LFRLSLNDRPLDVIATVPPMPLFVLACLVALFVAYVVGRAVGILLGIGPYATEAIAILVALVLIARAATRRRERA
jgi:hypothetical protein